LRARRRRCRRGRARRGARPPARAAFLPRRDRVRRQLLPEGRHCAEAARRQLGLPVPAAAGRVGGERAPEAARRAKAPATVALPGLAFKPNTDDMREAPSRIIAYRLLAEGAEVRAWDPVARPTDLQGVEICDSALEAVRDADAAVIVTEWPELRELPTADVR